MAKPIRISAEMLERAEAEGRVYKRSPPKQIEFWAEIGRQVASLVDTKDLFAVFTGAASLQIKHRASAPVATTDVLTELQNKRLSGALAESATNAQVSYGTDKSGRIRRISANGEVTLGILVDGQFVAATEQRLSGNDA